MEGTAGVKDLIQMKSKIMVGTRIHRKNAKPDEPINMEPLMKMAESLDYCDQLVVAVDASDMELVNQVKAVLENLDKVNIIEVPLWQFTPALNALLTFAMINRYQYIIYQSIEVQVNPLDVDKMFRLLTTDVLVVGLAFPDHQFEVGEHTINGGNTPWNTMAIWDVKKLGLIGFLASADGLIEGVEPGVEEVAAISLLQMLHPKSSKAILFQSKGEGGDKKWKTEWSDPERKAWHEKKMASKISRPATQLAALNLTPGEVIHITE